MSLVLEIEYLSGVCFAAVAPDSDTPDWPPEPDRVFSALVASWGARGSRSDERSALQWLEAQAAPFIDVSDATARTSATSFVPPNDPETGRSGDREVMPSFRRRQGRRFPAARPDVPAVSFVWPEANPDESTFSALDRLAFDTAYVGHSASLTRCRFRLATLTPADHWREPERGVYPGRLIELQKGFDMFARSGGRRGRPLQGAFVRTPKRTEAITPHAFRADWVVLEHVGPDSSMPDIRAAALVARAVRDTLLAAYERIGLGDRIPEVISGHAADGTPSRVLHLAIAPLPFVGWPHADGHVLGFALIPPRGSEILSDEAFRRALRAVAPMDENRGRRILTVQPKAGTAVPFQIELSPTFDPPESRRSLDPRQYSSSSRLFATVTPLVLDRHLKEKGDAADTEVRDQIARACENIGLPAPDSVTSHKHSAFEGAPSAWTSGRGPVWNRWKLPPALTTRPLIHAVIRFAEPVQGPLLLGAGRFVGLGLCRPLTAAGA